MLRIMPGSRFLYRASRFVLKSSEKGGKIEEKGMWGYVKMVQHLKSRGVLVQLHNDSVSSVVAEDIVEIGFDMWQGVLPQDDIPGIIEKTQGKLFLMGGIDMQKIDFPDATQEMVDAEVQRCLDTYMPLGHYMPCITSIFAVHPNVDAMRIDALNRLGAEYAAKHF